MPYKVFIDPGHGGHDPGATGNGMRESDIVLDVSLRLGELLKAAGLETRYSRGTDISPNFNSRIQAANAWDADLFISIHANAFHLPSANGYETFIAATKPQDRPFAVAIQNTYIKEIGLRDRGVRLDNQSQHSGGLGVLRNSRMPAVLVELGFISAGPEFADVPTLRNRRQEMAQALANGIFAHLGIDPQNNENEVEDMTQERFNEMMDVYLTMRGAEAQPSPWAIPEFQQAIDGGITDGTRPHSLATRQEVALMVLRASCQNK